MKRASSDRTVHRVAAAAASGGRVGEIERVGARGAGDWGGDGVDAVEREDAGLLVVRGGGAGVEPIRTSKATHVTSVRHGPSSALLRS